ncbi:MAG: 1,4-dihydroxy-6-naphthoate synthase [Alistipes sp.]|nr:1,4-dihydroxy-6-naphthoate synthase [Alistipes sp.]
MRLSISPCPNDTFMFDAIVNGRIDCEGLSFEVEYHDIEELNHGVEALGPDISKISCAVLPAIKQHYRLLDSGAALGRGNGPLLVRRKGDKGAIKHLLVPGEHTTANALVGRLFPQIEYREPMLFSKIAEAVERGDADGGVLIHEGRFVYERRNLELVADLGVEWERQTDLPLPLGGIVIKRELGDDMRSRVERVLRRSIEYAFDNPLLSRDYIKAHAQEMEDDVIEKHIALFVNDFSLSLGEQGRRALTLLTGLEEL